MRLGHLTRILRKPVLAGCAALLVAGGITLALTSGGCTDVTGLDGDALGAGLLNPGEMMRLNLRQPLQKPILDTLSSGFDEPNEEFPNARNVIAEDLETNSRDYVIGRNDLLQITMTEVTPGVETAKTTRVSESGNITLPLIGQVQAAGLTEAQLENAIRDAYQRSGLVRNAQIAVTTVEARQRTFQIRGAVQQPGQYAIAQSDFRLMDAIVLARDVTVPDIQYAYVIRPPADRAAAATQPASTQPAGMTPATPGTPATPPAGGGNLLEPHPATPPATAPAAPAPQPGTPGAAAPAPTGNTTLEDATKTTTTEKPPVFVNGNQVVDNAAGAAAAAPAPAPTTAPSTVTTTTSAPNDLPPLNPPMPAGATAAAQNFQFNAPLPEDQSTIVRVPLRQLLNGDMKFNVVIRPQDTIVIPTPQVGEFYMGGHVQRVGVYSLTGRQITLKQAIISAGMLDELGIPERTEVIRRLGRDREIFVKVNLAKVFRGQQPDVFLKPYDIVQVGTSPIAPFLSAIRNGFRITYGFGFIYDRNYYIQPQGAIQGSGG